MIRVLEEHQVGQVDIPVGGHADLSTAEHAAVAVFNRNGTLPPLILIRSWAKELGKLGRLADLLGEDQPVYAIGPPRHDRHDEYPDTVDEWAKFYLPVFASLELDGPLLMGGWSFGGVIALRMADMFAERGPEVRLIVMLDSRIPNPHPKEERTTAHKVIHHINQAMGMERASRAPYLRERARRQLNRAVSWARELLGLRQQGGHVSSNPKKDPLTRAIWVAYLKFIPQVSAIPVAQFACLPSVEHVCDLALGWTPFLRGDLETVVVPGEHMTMFEAPHVEVLAQRIRRTLARTRI